MPGVSIPSELEPLLAAAGVPADAVEAHMRLLGSPGSVLGETHLVAAQGRLRVFLRASMLDALAELAADPGTAPELRRLAWASSLVLHAGGREQAVAVPSYLHREVEALLERAVTPPVALQPEPIAPPPAPDPVGRGLDEPLGGPNPPKTAPDTVSGPSGATSEGVGATSEGVGATSEGVGATSGGVGATSDGLGATSDGLGATSDGVGAPPGGAERAPVGARPPKGSADAGAAGTNPPPGGAEAASRRPDEAVAGASEVDSHPFLLVDLPPLDPAAPESTGPADARAPSDAKPPAPPAPRAEALHRRDRKERPRSGKVRLPPSLVKLAVPPPRPVALKAPPPPTTPGTPGAKLVRNPEPRRRREQRAARSAPVPPPPKRPGRPWGKAFLVWFVLWVLGLWVDSSVPSWLGFLAAFIMVARRPPEPERVPERVPEPAPEPVEPEPFDAAPEPAPATPAPAGPPGQAERDALREAALKGQLGEVDRLVASGVPQDRAGAGGVPLLFEMAARGKYDLVDHLLRGRPDVNARVGAETALSRAVLRGDERLVGRLLEAGAVAPPGLVLLAAGSDHPALAAQLLNAPATPPLTRDELRTLLPRAAAGGPLSLVRALLDHGADVDGDDDDGCTALMHAAVQGRATVVKVLLDAGAQANRRTEDGVTALMAACWGARESQGDPSGAAARTVAGLLLDRGADVLARDVDGRTALDYARARGDADLASLLEIRGGVSLRT